MSKDVIPFTNSTDYYCWLHANCINCKKYYDLGDDGHSRCEIENAIALSACGFGLSPEMVKRMGGVESSSYPGVYNFFANKCTEFEPTNPS